MNELAYLEYIFMFDPKATWQHLFQFEQELSKFFNEHDKEVIVLKTVEGGQGRRILYIKSKQVSMIATETRPPGRPQTIKGHFKELTDRHYRAAARDFMNKGK